MKKPFYSKTAKGLVSLAAVIALLSSILASSIFYENNITANVVREASIDDNQISMQITAVNDIKGLNQLNEGFYEIRNGFVFYLEHFDSFAPLWIKVKNPEEQNGLLLVEPDGKLSFDESFEGLTDEKTAEESISNEEANQNQITGEVIGMEKVSGFATVTSPQAPKPPAVPKAPSAPTNIKPVGTDPTKIPKNTRIAIRQSEGTLIWYWKDQQGRLLSNSEGKDDTWNYIPNKFQLTVTDKSGKEIEEREVEAPILSDAINILRSDYPDKNVYKIKSLTAGGTQSIGDAVKLIPVGTGDKIGVYYMGTYIGTYDIHSEDYDKVVAELQILEQLKSQNQQSKLTLPDLVNLDFNTGQYENKDILEKIAQDLKIPIRAVTPSAKITETKIQLPEPLKDAEGNPINAWILNGKIIYDKTEVDTIIQKQFSNQALKTQKLASLNKIDERGGQLAKDPKDNSIWYFDTSTRRYEKITTPTYKEKETIGKDEDAVDVIKTFETDTQKQTGIEVKTKDGKSATIDEATLKRIKDSGGKGFGIAREGTEGKEQILEFRDPKTNTLLEKQTLSLGYTLDAGTKTTERFTTLYYLNGKEITKAEADKLKPEDKSNLKTLTNAQSYEVTEERENGKLKYLTTKQFDIIFDVQNNPMRTYQAVKVNQETNQVEEFTYGEGDKKIVVKTPNGISALDIFKSDFESTEDVELLDKAKTFMNQYASRQFFASLERVFTEFQGLGYYSTLFFEEDSLLKWRDKVDRAFATLYLGTEYWSSAICSGYIDGENEGIAYAETPQGLAQVAAHIEATRTEAIQTETGREFIYKITFNVRNGDFDKDLRAPEEMNVNVILKGEQTIPVFRQDQEVKRGSTLGRTGRNAIVKSSAALYNEICLTFDKTPLRWKISGKEICNTIQVSSGAPTPLGTQTTSTTQGTTGSSSEINDF